MRRSERFTRKMQAGSAEAVGIVKAKQRLGDAWLNGGSAASVLLRNGKVLRAASASGTLCTVGAIPLRLNERFPQMNMIVIEMVQRDGSVRRVALEVRPHGALSVISGSDEVRLQVSSAGRVIAAGLEVGVALPVKESELLFVRLTVPREVAK